MAAQKKDLTRERFLAALKKSNQRIKSSVVSKAYDLAKHAHANQRRIGGEEYFYHPLQVASLVAKYQPETTTVCAALLHDTVEDTAVTMKKIKEIFDDDILFLVDALTKIEHYEDIHFNKLRTKEKILHYGNLDSRVFLIKLLDVYHNLLTITSLPEPRRRTYAREAYYFFSPIADELKLKKLGKKIRELADPYVQH